MTADGGLYLGVEGERAAASLLAAVELQGLGLSVHFVYLLHENEPDSAATYRELVRRVQGLSHPGGISPVVSVGAPPADTVVGWVQETGRGYLPGARFAPIAWLDLRCENPDSRRQSLVAMNVKRDFLCTDGGVTLVIVMKDAEERRFCPDLASIADHSLIFRNPPTPKRVMTGPIGFLHISDLHISGSKGWDADVVRANFIHDLPSLLNHANVVPHLVFASGDMTDRGDTRGFLRANEFLQRVMEICAEHVPEADRLLPDGTLGHDLRDWHMPRLFIVPGNHDAVRAGVKRTQRALQTTLWSKLSKAAEYRQELGDWWDDGTFAEMGDARLRDFYEFTRLVLGDARQTPSGGGHRTDVVTVRGLRIGILQLNSAWMCSEDDYRQKCVPIGERQVRDALEELRLCGGAEFTIAVIHHPPGWWPEPERKAIDALLREACDVVMHGHVHDQEWVHSSGPNGELVVLTAGALYESSTRKHAFQLGVLDPLNKNLRVHSMTYSSQGRGHWHVDAGMSPGNPTGVFEFPLKRVLQSGISASPQRGNPVGIADRLARIAAQVHGAVDFVGFPTETGRPPQARIETLFVPQRYSIWRAGTMTFEDLLAAILGPREVSLGRHVPKGSGTGLLDSGMLTRAVTSTNGSTLQDSFHRQASAFVILGEPGSGKSLTTRALAYFAAKSEPSKVPILVTLRNWLATGSELGLLEFAARELGTQLSETVSVEALRGLCEAGKAILLIDGFDEVVIAERRTFVRDAVVALATAYPNLAVVCTSRVLGYRDAPLPGEFAELSLQAFDDDEQEAFARKWFDNQFSVSPREAEQRRLRFMAALRAEPRAQELARNPLLATLIAMVHVGEAQLPSERARLYELLVRLLVETWPRSSGRSAWAPTGFDGASQRRLLEYVAFEMQMERARASDDDDEVFWEVSDILVSRSRLEFLVAQGVACIPEIMSVSASGGARVWIEFIASHVGALVEHAPGQFGFIHLSVLEYLAGCEAWRRWGVVGHKSLALKMTQYARHVHHHEMLLFMLGNPSVSMAISDKVVGGCDSLDFKLLALRDNIPLSDKCLNDVFKFMIAWGSAAMVGITSEQQRTSLPLLVDQIIRFSARNGQRLSSEFEKQLLASTPALLVSTYWLAGERLRLHARLRPDWKSTASKAGSDMVDALVRIAEQRPFDPHFQFGNLWALYTVPEGALVASHVGSFAVPLGAAASSVSLLRFDHGKILSMFGARGFCGTGHSRSLTAQEMLSFVPLGLGIILGFELVGEWGLRASTLAATRAIELRHDLGAFRQQVIAVLNEVLQEILIAAAHAGDWRLGDDGDGPESSLEVQQVLNAASFLSAEFFQRVFVGGRFSVERGLSIKSYNRRIAVDSAERVFAEGSENWLQQLAENLFPPTEALVRLVGRETVAALSIARIEPDYPDIVIQSELAWRLAALWSALSLADLREALLVRQGDTPAARAKVAAYALMSRSILGEWPIDTEWLDAWRAAGEPDDWSERYVWRLCNAFDDPENVALADAARQVLTETIAAHPDKHERDVAEWLQNMDLHPMTAAEREAEARAAEIRWFEDVEKFGDAGWGNIVQRHYTKAPAEAKPPSDPTPKAKRSSKKNLN